MKTTGIIASVLVVVVILLVAWIFLVHGGRGLLVDVENVGLAGGHTSGFIERINGEERSITVNGKECFVPESAEILEGDRAMEFEDLEVGERIEITTKQEIKTDGEEWKEGEMEIVKVRVIG
jgi:hypothetical protein